MLAQGTLTLKTDGATRIRADADINNAPIVSAFQRAALGVFWFLVSETKAQNSKALAATVPQ